MVRSDFIVCIGRRWTSTIAQRCQVLSLWHRSAMKGDIERCRKTSADVQWWKYECTISRHLYWNDVTLMVHSDFIAAHRSTNICVRNAGGHVQKAVSANVGWCKAIEVWMHSTTIFRFQGPPFWHENYRSPPPTANHINKLNFHWKTFGNFCSRPTPL